MKKALALCFAVSLFSVSLSGCGPSVPPELQAPPAEPMTTENTEAAGPGGMADAADPF